jgi:hypothetical protein
MAKLSLIETIQTKLPTLTKQDGQLIVVRDNASLYVDLDGNRVYISDWIDISTDEERLAMISPLSNKYYYVVETNKIWRYVSGSWVLASSIYTHPTSGVTAGDYAGVTVDDQGHITAGTSTLPISQGGTGQTSIANIYRNIICKSGANTNPQYVVGFNSGYNGNGYVSIQDLRNTMGLGNTTDALPIENGGTGSTTAEDALTSLGAAPLNHAHSNMTGASSSVDGTSGLVPAPASGKQSSFLRGDGTWATPTNTKNTAGSTDSSSKLFLIGATSQNTNPQTYSHDTAYVGTDGCLYSDNTKVSVEGHSHSVVTESTNGFMASTDKTKLNVTNIGYGTCDTDAETAEKVITITGNDNWQLSVGSIIIVKFTNTNTATNPTLNVNGTGAKSVWLNTGLITTTSSHLAFAGTANRPIKYVYDGTNWIFMGWSTDSNTTYSTQALGNGYGTCATAEATTAKAVTLSSYTLKTGGFVAVKFTYAVPANATMNINSKGAKKIFYRGAAITTGIIKASDIALFVYDGTQYDLLCIDRCISNTEITSSTEPSNQAIGEFWLSSY